MAADHTLLSSTDRTTSAGSVVDLGDDRAASLVLVVAPIADWPSVGIAGRDYRVPPSVELTIEQGPSETGPWRPLADLGAFAGPEDTDDAQRIARRAGTLQIAARNLRAGTYRANVLSDQ